jgi:hypothetical protein
MGELLKDVDFSQKKYVIYGESEHGIDENHAFAADMFRHLVQKEGIRVFVMESSWRIEDVFQAYVSEGDAVFQSPEYALAANAFRSKHLESIFAFAKQHNKEHPQDAIIITGFQPESPVSDINEIENFGSAHSDSEIRAAVSDVRLKCSLPQHLKTDIAFMSHAAARRKAQGVFLSNTEYDLCQNALENLSNKVTGSFKYKIVSLQKGRLQASLMGLQFMFLTISKHIDAEASGKPETELDVYTIGDNYRFKVFQELIEKPRPGKKAMFWMHNWHAAKNSSVLGTEGRGMPAKGAVSFGTLFAKERPGQTLTIATVTFNHKYDYSAKSFLEPVLNTHFSGRTGMMSTQGFPEIFEANQSLYLQGNGAHVDNVMMSEQFDYIIFSPTLTRI